MLRFRLSFLLVLTLLFGTRSVLASTFAVGTCKPSLPSFATISAAVAAVPTGSTVLVCPGTYPEQVIISTPLTLEGIASGDADQAIITVPAGGLTTTPGIAFSLVAPQVEVTMAGPVNIINITVDGMGGGNMCSSRLVGIYYGSGSSGTVNEVTVRNELNNNCGHGIMAENGTSNNEVVTIENSSVHDVDYAAIMTSSNVPPILTVTIKGNEVSSGLLGIYPFSAAGSVTSNIVTNSSYGVFSQAASVTISGNTLADNADGIYAGGQGDIITSNKIGNIVQGIQLANTGMTIKSNVITKSNVGIEFSCNTGNTVSSNTINDAVIGLDSVPASSTPIDVFFNVATIKKSCGFAAVSATPPAGPIKLH